MYMLYFQMTVIAGEDVSFWTFYISWRIRILDLLPGFKIKIFQQADFLFFFIYIKINFYIHTGMKVYMGGFLFATVIA